MTGLPIDKAAAELHVSVPTLRRWLRAGCPQSQRGRRGRGHAALIEVQAVRDWRDGSKAAGDAGRVLAELAAVAPEIAVEVCIQTLGQYSIRTSTGAEHRLLRLAVGDAGRRFADALTRWAENRSQGEHF